MEAAASASTSSSVSSSVDGRSGGLGGSDYLFLGMFGGSQQSGVSDLLLGAGGFSSSLGNGFGNEAGAPNSSNAGGASSGVSAFDLSDFPSLGGTTNNGGSSNNSGNGLAAALRQQQQLLAHQQMLQGPATKQNNLYRLAMSSGSNGGANFTMATEDFPALPGAPPSSGLGGGNSGTAPSSSPLLMGGSNMQGGNSAVSSQGFGAGVSSVSRAPSNNSGLYGGDLDSNGGSQLDGSGLLGGGGIGGLGVLGGLQQNSSNQPTSLNLQSSRGGSASSVSSGGGLTGGPGSGSVAGTALSGDFGLLGLLGVIRMTDADRNALALGSDLTMLGLNLGSTEHIYNTFASPWSESSASTKEPHYQVR
jgi:hypothetical protein